MREANASAMLRSETSMVVRRRTDARALRRTCVRELHGGILLELLLAIALFVGGAVLVLGAMRSAVDGARRADLRARAMDLAQSRIAELDAGLIAVGDLDGDELAGDDLAGDDLGSSDGATARGSDSDLAVSLELLPLGTGERVVLARATVRARDGGDDGSGTIITTVDRVVAGDESESERGSR
jgi:type II secretory pathway pseudopilin PulG